MAGSNKHNKGCLFTCVYNHIICAVCIISYYNYEYGILRGGGGGGGGGDPSAPETISGSPKCRTFLLEHAPRSPRDRVHRK